MAGDPNTPGDKPNPPENRGQGDPHLPDRVTACVAAVEKQVATLRQSQALRDKEDLRQLAQELEQVFRHEGHTHLSAQLRELEESLTEEAEIGNVSEKLEALIQLCRRGNGPGPGIGPSS